MESDRTALEVELLDCKGRTCAQFPAPASKLMVLHDAAEAIAVS